MLRRGGSRSAAWAAALGLIAGAHAPAAAGAADWWTYHGSGARTGYAKDGPRPEKVHRLWSSPVDGKVYAEPLVVAGRVLAATEGNSVYAFDAVGGKRLWRTNLGAPVPSADLDAAVAPGCGNIDPSGITGTPVVDRAAGVVYVVALLRQPIRHELVAIGLKHGHVRWRRRIDPPGADPRIHQQRAALALSKGRVYVAYGGLAGDCGNYRGWVLGSRTSGAGPLVSYSPPVKRQAGIWGPSGPAVAGDGHLYVATGDGDSSSFDYGDSVIRLTPELKVVDYFAPAENGQLNTSDQDLGSVGPMLLPDQRAFVIGKSGVGYLLDRRHLGGIGHPLFAEDFDRDSYGGLAYAGDTIFIPFRLAGVKATRLGPARTKLAWSGPVFRAGPPIVAGSAVWTIALDESRLYALDRVTGKVRFRRKIPLPAQFSTPTAVGGRVYLAGGGQVLAFGEG